MWIEKLSLISGKTLSNCAKVLLTSFFSYHDFGVSDLPAIIDYVLKTTNKKKMPYVGFSEGTTQFFVMASERPEYNAKISQANFWAPVTNMYRITCKPIDFLAQVGVIEEVCM